MIRDLVERGLSRVDMRVDQRADIAEALTQAIRDAADQIVQDRLRSRPAPDETDPRRARPRRGAARSKTDDPIDP